MLKIASLTANIRFRMKDMHGVSISDFEIIEAVNSATALIFERLADNACAVSNKKAMLMVDGGSTALPRDFYRIRNVSSYPYGTCKPSALSVTNTGEYRITGQEFYAADDDYSIEYSYIPTHAESPNDFIDAPESLRLPIVEVAVAFIKGDIQSADALAIMTAKRFAGAHISHMPDTGPVEIWGGKG